MLMGPKREAQWGERTRPCTTLTECMWQGVGAYGRWHLEVGVKKGLR